MMNEQEVRRVRKIYLRTESRVRHFGYVLFFGLGALVFLPIMLGAIQGVQNDRVWDPFTGAQVSASERVVKCVEEAADLMLFAGELGKFDTRWERRFRRWVTRCQSDNPQLFDLLSVTRDRLQRVRSASGIQGQID